MTRWSIYYYYYYYIFIRTLYNIMYVSIISEARFWFQSRLLSGSRYPSIVQSTPGGGVKVTPEFWVAQLWRRLMGRFVLDIQQQQQEDGGHGGDSSGGRSGGGSGSLPGSVRVYAHAGIALDGRAGIYSNIHVRMYELIRPLASIRNSGPFD